MDSKSDIAEIVGRCLQLFNNCSTRGLTNDVLSTFEGQQRRLRQWANSVNVFARPHVNLDAQLRRTTNNTIPEMVMLLLNVLEENLSVAFNTISTKRKSEPTTTLLLQEPEILVLQQNNFQIPFFGIDGSIKRLEKMSTAILDATEASLHRRVRAYQEKYKDKELERNVCLYLLGRFPNIVPECLNKKMRLASRKDARSDEDELTQYSSDDDESAQDFHTLLQSSEVPGIFRALYKSILSRHYRIIYERERRLKDRNHHARVEDSPRLSESFGFGSRSIQEHREPTLPPLPDRDSAIPNHTPSEPTIPPTIDESSFDARMQNTENHQSVGTWHDGADTVSESGHASFPKPPHFGDVTEGQCTICGQRLSIDTFEGARWIAHVKKDIKRYVCIFEDCEQIPCYFERRREWVSHMHKTHTSKWVRSLHNPVIWRCPEPGCHLTSGKEFASKAEAQEDWIKHMKQKHAELGAGKIQSLASISTMPQLRAVNKCPICGDDQISEGSPQHAPQSSNAFESKDITPREAPKSQESRKRKVARFAEPGASGIVEDAGDLGNPTRLTPLRPLGNLAPQACHLSPIEKHIGRHLSNMALHFTSRFIEIEQDGQNAGRESDASFQRQRGSLTDSDISKVQSPEGQECEDEPDRFPVATEPFQNESLAKEYKEQLACIDKNREQLRLQAIEDLEEANLASALVAAKHEHKDIVRQLFQSQNADLGTKSIDGWMPLSWAALEGYVLVVKRLLENDMVDQDKTTPLLLAARRGHEAIVKLLLDNYRVNPNAKDVNGQTPLILAITSGYKAVVELLLDNSNVDLDLTDNAGQTPFTVAATNGHKDIVQLLLDNGGVNPNERDSRGRTPLILAASNGHKDVVQLLLDNEGVNPNERDSRGRTPLILATRNGHKDVVQLLLNNDGVNLDENDEYGGTPLIKELSGYQESFRRSLNVQAPSSKGRTPLYLAVCTGDVNTVEAVIDAGIDRASHVDNTFLNELCDEKTPLMQAAFLGYAGVVSLLLDRGADHRICVQRERLNCLHYAVESDRAKEDVIMAFQGKMDFDQLPPGTTLDSQETPSKPRYETPMMLHISLAPRDSYRFLGQDSIWGRKFKALLEGGANVNGTYNTGLRALEKNSLEFAVRENKYLLVSVLVRAGATLPLGYVIPPGTSRDLKKILKIAVPS